MKVLIATDAWKPQVNGVVATLGHLAEEAAGLGAEIEFVTPAEFRTVPLPNYPEVRLSLLPPGAMERRLDAIKPDAIHIATEGPIGSAMRRLACRRGLAVHDELPYAISGVYRGAAAGAAAMERSFGVALAAGFSWPQRRGHGRDADIGRRAHRATIPEREIMAARR